MTAKTSGRPQTGAPKYHRLTAGDRTTILIGKLEGKSAGEIARELGVARSTVTRELKRNACGWGTYRDEYAQRAAAKRAAAKATKRRKFSEAMWR